MNNLKLVIIFLFFILNSCTQTIQNNGLSEKNIENFNIKIGKTSKKYLINKFCIIIRRLSDWSDNNLDRR